MPARASYLTYDVVKGDTLAAIARRFGSTVQAIATASGITNPDRIDVGQALLIPVAATPAAGATKTPAPVKAVATVSPASLPNTTAGSAAGIASWFEPPRLWFTIGVVATLAWQIMKTGRRRDR